MSARRILIAGNWKMNCLSADATALAGGLAEKLTGAGGAGAVNFEMLVCPPAVLIPVVAKAIAGSPLQLGGQDCHMNAKGAHTGDTAAAMLKDAGCGYVIVGHSERRTDHAETDAIVNAKAAAAHANGLVAVICIGETEAQRDAGKTLDVNGSQIAGSVPEGSTAANTVIAYEPVWAIGTGRTPTSAEVQDVHAFIRGELAKKIGAGEAAKTRILYGGSMNPKNAKELLALADVDGGLIGGASLKVDDFWAVATSA
jgi:triosephosphate isomerase